MTFVERMVGAAKLSSAAYEDVEADKGAMGQALAVVVLSSLAAGIGAGAGVRGLVVGTVASLIGWLVWAFLIYLIGARWLAEPGTQSDTGELMRTIGFATAPGLLRVIGIVPFLTAIVFTIAAFWMLATMVVAVRQALDYKSTWRAVGVCLLGWIVQLAAFIVFGRLVGG
jgi:Yip1 domain